LIYRVAISQPCLLELPRPQKDSLAVNNCTFHCSADIQRPSRPPAHSSKQTNSGDDHRKAGLQYMSYQSQNCHSSAMKLTIKSSKTPFCLPLLSVTQNLNPNCSIQQPVTTRLTSQIIRPRSQSRHINSQIATSHTKPHSLLNTTYEQLTSRQCGMRVRSNRVIPCKPTKDQHTAINQTLQNITAALPIIPTQNSKPVLNSEPILNSKTASSAKLPGDYSTQQCKEQRIQSPRQQAEDE
jgi:hypothetical protein